MSYDIVRLPSEYGPRLVVDKATAKAEAIAKAREYVRMANDAGYGGAVKFKAEVNRVNPGGKTRTPRLSAKHFDPRSVRTFKLRGGGVLTVACPHGEFNTQTGECGIARRANPTIVLPFDEARMFSEWHAGQSDPVYAVVSRRGSSVDWVPMDVSVDELHALVKTAGEVIKSPISEDWQKAVAWRFTERVRKPWTGPSPGTRVDLRGNPSSEAEDLIRELRREAGAARFEDREAGSIEDGRVVGPSARTRAPVSPTRSPRRSTKPSARRCTRPISTARTPRRRRTTRRSLAARRSG